MIFHFQKNVICFTLTNIFSFETNNIEAKKEDMKINTYKNETTTNQFHCGICWELIVICLFAIWIIKC